MACLRGGAVVVAGAVIALAATACGAESVMRHVEPSEAEAVSETPVAPEQGIDERPVRQIVDADGVPVEFVDISIPSEDEIEELPYEIIRQHEYVFGVDTTVKILAVAPDGDALISQSDVSDFDTGSFVMKRSNRVGIWSDDGFRLFEPSEETFADDLPRQAYEGSFAADRVVWVESTSGTLYEDSWRIFSRPREGGESKLIAYSEQVFPEGPHPNVAGFLNLVASEDEVAWHASFRRDDGTIRTAVVSVPADGGELTIEQELATLPASSDAGWVTLRMVDASVENVDPEWRIQDPRQPAGIDLVMPSGEVRTLVSFVRPDGEEWSAGPPAAGGDSFAWIQDQEIMIAGIDGSFAYRIDVDEGTRIDPWSLEVCDGRIHWAVYHGSGEWTDPMTMYAFDPVDRRIREIMTDVDSQGLVTCAGDYVSWVESEKLVVEDGYTENQRVVVARWLE